MSNGMKFGGFALFAEVIQNFHEFFKSAKQIN
jgi:hypothetical protein